MSINDKVINFITNEKNIEITNKNKELIIDKFYLNFTNKFLGCLR